MRVTVLSLDDPWERSHGGTLRTRAIVEATRDLGHDVHVVYPGSAPGQAAELEGVTYHTVNARPVGERSVPPAVSRVKRALLPLPTLRGGLILELTRALARVGETDVLCVSQLRAAQYLAHAGPSARLWLDQSDLWSEMLGPEIERRSGVTRLTATAQRHNVQRAEQKWFSAASAVTAAGRRDAAMIEVVAGPKVRWLPNPVVAPRVRPPKPESFAVGLLGSFAYWPNRDAYDLLTRSWLPQLRDAGIPCLVAGYDSQSLPPATGIDLHGPVSSLEDFYSRVSVTLAPIRLGGGMKVKVAESLVHDRPVLATEKALEGFDDSLRSSMPVVSLESPDIRGALRALSDDAGLFDRAREVFSTASFEATVRETLEGIGE